MLLISLLALGFIGAIVQAQPPLPIGQLVNIKDPQGNVFDLAFGSPAELAPVQSLNHKPFEGAQAWVINSAGLASISNAAQTFLSFTTAISGVNPTCAQVCGHSVDTHWNITANHGGTGYNIIEPNSQLAVMSWPASTSSITTFTAPLSLQNFDPNEPQQIFNFPLWS